MGVQSLWQLLDQVGRPVDLEQLEGKVLAVDVSIWLHQIVRAMRDSRGELVENAHIHAMLTRICKLMYHQIKPVFVFDGAAPAIKKQAVVSRCTILAWELASLQAPENTNHNQMLFF